MVKTASGQITLVTGPARSGKSEWAEHLARRSTKPVIYVATASLDPSDPEWQARITQHQQRRPPDWSTLEVPQDLASTIRNTAATDCLLIDSLGTWLANVLMQDEPTWTQTLTEVIESLRQARCEVILVAEETGWGVVPAYPLGRSFRDRLGSLVRQVGAIAEPVYLVTGGYVLNLSHLGTPLPSEDRQ